MPWQTPSVQKLTNQARDLIKNMFKIEIKTQVFVVSEQEMIDATIIEQQQLKKSKKDLEIITFELKFILGKYFAEKKEVWVVEGRGEILDVIIHELLHSIQNCLPKREHIVDYITFKITNNSDYILESVLKDWSEIEKTYGIKAIIKRLLEEGNCEHFD